MKPFRVFAIGVLAALALATPWAVFAYANPGEPQGYVSDFGDMLSPEEITDITADLSVVASSGIAQIAVVTIPSLEGDTIENFAVRLFEDWKIGDAERDNGALLLIARDDREVRIEVGYGLEGDLTDAISSRIIRNVITPNFQNEAYGAGIKEAVGAMAGALGVDSFASSSVPEDAPAFPRLPNNWVWLVFFIPIWITSVLARSKSWWAGGVLGGLIGTAVGIFAGFLYAGIIAIAVLIPVGLLFDFLVSRAYTRHKSGGGQIPPWWMGGGGMLGGGGGSFGGHGGFGGFGGGSSGGGGASGKW